MSTHRKIESKFREQMNSLAGAIDHLFNPPGRPKRVAFTLLLTEFGQISGGRVNYISNGQREDMVTMIKELLARIEGRHPEETQQGASETPQ